MSFSKSHLRLICQPTCELFQCLSFATYSSAGAQTGNFKKSPGLLHSGLFGSRREPPTREGQRSTPNVRTVEYVTPPPVSVIVIGKVPIGAFLATVRVKWDVPEPVGDKVKK